MIKILCIQLKAKGYFKNAWRDNHKALAYSFLKERGQDFTYFSQIIWLVASENACVLCPRAVYFIG